MTVDSSKLLNPGKQSFDQECQLSVTWHIFEICAGEARVMLIKDLNWYSLNQLHPVLTFDSYKPEAKATYVRSIYSDSELIRRLGLCSISNFQPIV